MRAVRAGARSVVEAMMGAASPLAFPPAVGAAVAVALARERGVRAQVMMPYTDRLGRFSHWFVQLWAESLGKDGQGTAPIACVGPLDQHSQLQLFMDGPREHLITVVRTADGGPGAEAARRSRARGGRRLPGRQDRGRSGGGASRRPCRRRWAAPAGRCAPSISTGLTRPRSAR